MKFPNVFHDTDANTEAGKVVPSKQISLYRRYLPQVLASSAKNLLNMDYGLAIAYSTILIPALSGLNSAVNSNETLRISPDQATWLASLTVICQPIGGLSSGFITEPLGRKLALVFVNIPYVIAWILLYYASSLTMIYIAFILLGLAIGLMEAPVFTYIGEICEPNTRGILTASTNIASALGMTIVYFLGIHTSWRNAALICSSLPLVSMLIISFMPETPLWLLGKNRQADALKSLQWLRGWVSASAVQDEFEELKRFKSNAQKCYDCYKQNNTCPHPPPTINEKIRDLFRRRTLRPFILISSLYFLSATVGITPFRPYMVQVLYFYESPIDANEFIVWMGYIGIVANILLVCSIRPFGKRTVYLWSIAIVIITLFLLGIYGFLYLSLDKTSFDIKANSTDFQKDLSARQYFPIMAFIMLQFFTNYGVSALANMMNSEVFPFKSKAFASGVVVTVYYFSSFISSKLFYVLESVLTLPGLGMFYGLIGTVGFVGMYLYMPETEGRSLEEIETYYSDHKRKLNDIHIPYNRPT